MPSTQTRQQPITQPIAVRNYLLERMLLTDPVKAIESVLAGYEGDDRITMIQSFQDRPVKQRKRYSQYLSNDVVERKKNKV